MVDQPTPKNSVAKALSSVSDSFRRFEVGSYDDVLLRKAFNFVPALLGPSTLGTRAGLGVFASAEIKKGTIISLMPGPKVARAPPSGMFKSTENKQPSTVFAAFQSQYAIACDIDVLNIEGNPIGYYWYLVEPMLARPSHIEAVRFRELAAKHELASKHERARIKDLGYRTLRLYPDYPHLMPFVNEPARGQKANATFESPNAWLIGFCSSHKQLGSDIVADTKLQDAILNNPNYFERPALVANRTIKDGEEIFVSYNADNRGYECGNAASGPARKKVKGLPARDVEIARSRLKNIRLGIGYMDIGHLVGAERGKVTKVTWKGWYRSEGVDLPFGIDPY